MLHSVPVFFKSSGSRCSCWIKAESSSFVTDSFSIVVSMVQFYFNFLL